MNDNPIVAMGIGVFELVIVVFFIVAAWKVFVKAGKPGWAILIPFYNLYVLLKIIGRPGWWIILYFIPIVNIVVQIIIAIDLAKSFGRSTAFGVIMLWLLSFIGYPILAFGNSKYIGSAVGGSTRIPPGPVIQPQPSQPLPSPVPSNVV